MNEQSFKIISEYRDNIDNNHVNRVSYIIDDGLHLGVLTSTGTEVKIVWYDDHKFSYLERIAENYVENIAA